MKPATFLLATFLSTSVVACAARAGKKDIYQARIMGFCALGAAIAGAVREAELIDFIFAYLLWGCIVGVGGSWIVHRLLNWGRPNQECWNCQDLSEEKRTNEMEVERG